VHWLSSQKLTRILEASVVPWIHGPFCVSASRIPVITGGVRPLMACSTDPNFADWHERQNKTSSRIETYLRIIGNAPGSTSAGAGTGPGGQGSVAVERD
jgi:hypothetical protein